MKDMTNECLTFIAWGMCALMRCHNLKQCELLILRGILCELRARDSAAPGCCQEGTAPAEMQSALPCGTAVRPWAHWQAGRPPQSQGPAAGALGMAAPRSGPASWRRCCDRRGPGGSAPELQCPPWSPGRGPAPVNPTHAEHQLDEVEKRSGQSSFANRSGLIAKGPG